MSRETRYFYDIKYREGIQNFESLVAGSLVFADYIKASEDEVRYLSEMPRKIFITRGEQGAEFLMDDKRYIHVPQKIEVVDTTGCGDAFSASCIFGILRGWDPQKIVDNAVEYSASVATYKGTFKDIK
jgi:sugar/nucleoside kinase (ribokinase family)